MHAARRPSTSPARPASCSAPRRLWRSVPGSRAAIARPRTAACSSSCCSPRRRGRPCLARSVMWGKRTNRLGGFLAEGSEIEGKYTCTGTVMLDAKLRGEIVAKDTLVIGDHGVVEATVRAVVLVIRGRLVGKVTASERVELKSSARVTGDVEAPVIVVE